MGDYASLVAEEITATLDRAGFEGLSSESFRIEVTDSFQRKLGACRPARRPDESADTARYEIRIARRLFEDDTDADWRNTVRHEIAPQSGGRPERTLRGWGPRGCRVRPRVSGRL